MSRVNQKCPTNARMLRLHRKAVESLGPPLGAAAATLSYQHIHTAHSALVDHNLLKPCTGILITTAQKVMNAEEHLLPHSLRILA